jgi:cyanobactin maturation PatA/PatG family protease
MTHQVLDDHRLGAEIEELQRQSLGHDEIIVAVLDGPADLAHECFQGAHVRRMEAPVTQATTPGLMAAHGTHVASIIFGQPGSPLHGIAPRCRGLIIPIFSDLAPARISQLDLARAIEQAVGAGAHIINVSGGERIEPGASDPLLVRAVEQCRKNGTLILAAAGNDGCACLHTPAALPSVLTVGASDAQGFPLASSNWAETYAKRGILAPGQNIWGAVPGGGIQAFTGTSFATPIVTAIAALLLSIQVKQGRKPDPFAVRDALLASAIPCDPKLASDCRRFLAGRLNVSGAQALIQGGTTMSETIAEGMTPPAIEAPSLVNGVAPSSQHSEEAQPGVGASASTPADVGRSSNTATPLSRAANSPSRAADPGVQASTVTPSCGCAPKISPPLVYAIGQLNYDFGTEARRDSFKQSMPYKDNFPPNPYDQSQMVFYLKEEDHANESTALIWTLNLELTPIYALDPVYPYAPKVYEFFRKALEGQIAKKDSDGYVSRVSIPGVVTNRKVRLFSGQVVPVVEPEYRGMYSWNLNSLIDQSMKKAGVTKEVDKLKALIQEFLNRIYYDLRNLGSAPQDRALNYSATNAFQMVEVWNNVMAEGRQLADMEVVKSPYCRMDSDCWDVKLIFFDPENDQRARKAYRFTIDVSDMMPVTVGEVRSWTEPAI